jgi:hypothetical protein
LTTGGTIALAPYGKRFPASVRRALSVCMREADFLRINPDSKFRAEFELHV